MANKPFAIQGSTLTIGGVDLQAGSNGVVIPGVTRAASFKVEEVDERDGTNPDIFGSNEGAVTVIDNAEYLYLVDDGDVASNSYIAAEYSVGELDDGEIHEVNVESAGVFAAADKTRVEAGNMWATLTPTPFVSFNSANWTQIPYRPKIQANAVESIGGGGANLGNISNGAGDDNDPNSLSSSESNTYINFAGGPGNDELAFGSSNGAVVKISTDSGGTNFEFTASGSAGSIKFPDGSVQTTAYTGQTSSSGELYIMANIDGDIVTSTNGIDWTDPQPSGMAGINRVEIHGGVIVYTPGSEGPSLPGLYYSTQLGTVTLCTGTAVSVESNSLIWNEVHYFSSTDKWVAVGYNQGTNHYPVLAHSDNGIDWTVVFADNTFVSGFNTLNDDWQLNDVAWLDETNQYVITSDISRNTVFGGIFLTADITTALDGSNHVAIDFDAAEVAPWSVVGFGGPPGYMLLTPNSGGTVWFGYGSTVGNYAADIGFWDDAVANQIGYIPEISEVAYRNGNFIAVTPDGQVITPTFIGPGGSGFTVSVPLPFANMVISITNANPAVITWGIGSTPENNNEKIVITLAGEYNGTYYVNTDTSVLYTDLAMTTALDASGFAAFASGTVTFSHGMYFDAAGVSNSYYYIGNDDEQIFRSSNGVNWTQQADFNGDFFNDFAYGAFGAAPVSTFDIPNTVKGFINLVGDRPNNEDDAWFESVVVHGNYAYVLGGDSYIDNSNGSSKVYKFDVRTGEQVWVNQIHAGRGATFDLSVGIGAVTITGVSTAGQGYKVNEEIVIPGFRISGNVTNRITIIVASIDNAGGVVTATVKPGYDVGLITGTFSNVYAQYQDAQGDPCAIAYDEFTDQLIVVSEYLSGRGSVEDNTWSSANVYRINPLTGAVISTATLTDQGDIYPNSIATHASTGKIAVVGEKYNEYLELGALTIANKFNGYFNILKSSLDPIHYPGAPGNYYGNFWITGTGIAGQENIDQVNVYTNLPTTTRQGSGSAQFQMVDNGNGTYGIGVTTTANSINYRVGHKLLVLGTALGGATPANDCLLTVTEIDGNGGIVNAAIVSGTAAGTVYTLYDPVTGTNSQVGSGSAREIYVNLTTGVFENYGSNSDGLRYVIGDVLTIAGTVFAGGTSPANDVTMVVNNIGGSGEAYNTTIAGTGPTTELRIRVDGVDFTAADGAWAMRQNLSGQAFVWTPTWTNDVGSGGTDSFYDATWNSNGTALYAVGTGQIDVNDGQAMVVKFDAADGSILWSKDIKFNEAQNAYRSARAVCPVPNSDDIMVGGEWYNNSANATEIILTRITPAGAAVWQKTYGLYAQGGEEFMSPNFSIKAVGSNIAVSFRQNTNNDSGGLGYLVIDPVTGLAIRHRVFSSDSNGNYSDYNTPTANWTDVYSDATGDYVVMAGYTYVPTDSSHNALLMKLPLDGLVDIAVDTRLSIGEHIMNRHTVNVTTMTSGFVSLTLNANLNSISTVANARNYVTTAPSGELHVWTQPVTDDGQGYLEFGDGSKQSFATDRIPQILAANDYWLTAQDSGKHIFFEHESGRVYIPHRSVRYFPVGFTFTIVNTTGSDCYLRHQSGMWTQGALKLAGRNITTPEIGIPDSGSGSMVTVMKIKDGYTMSNSSNDNEYPDIWIVSGPGDVYDDY